MADNEIPTNTLNVSSEVDASPPVRLEQMDTSQPVDDYPDKSKYIIRLENEVKEFIDFQQQYLRNKLSELSQPISPLPPSVFGPIPPDYHLWMRLAMPLLLIRSVKDNLVDNDRRIREWTSSQIKETYSKNGGKQRHQERRRNRNVVDGPSWCVRCRARHNGPCTPLTARCAKCGIFGHSRKDCNYPGNVCWNCKMEGHQVSQCCGTVGLGSEVVGESSSPGQKRKESSAVDDVSTDTEKTQ